MRLPRRILATLLGMALLLSMAALPATAAAPRHTFGGGFSKCEILSAIDRVLDQFDIPDSQIDDTWSRLCD